MRFVLKNPCQQLCIFSVASCQRSSACPIAQRLQTTWKVLGAQFFETIALMEFVPKTRANSSASQYVTSSQRSSPQAISHAIRPVSTLVSLLPNGTLPNLFPTASHPYTVSTLPSRSLPTERSPSYFRRFPPSVHDDVHASVLLPPNGALWRFTMSALPSRSLPTELSPSYFRSTMMSTLPSSELSDGSRCPRFRLAPSQRSSPRAIFDGSRPSTMMSTLPSCSLATELSDGSRCPRFRLAPSQRSSPRAIFDGFPSVHDDVHASVLLPGNGALWRFTMSTLPSCSLPTELSPSYFPRFPFRSPCRRFRIVPSRQSKLNENASIGDAFGKKL